MLIIRDLANIAFLKTDISFALDQRANSNILTTIKLFRVNNRLCARFGEKIKFSVNYFK